jgi:hypothetical protein
LTVDVDVLVTAEGLSQFRNRWLNRGYGREITGLARRSRHRNRCADQLSGRG